MKKELFYILLLLLFSMTTTAQTTQTDFDYHLDWGGDRIHVTLHYTLPNPGDTIFIMGIWTMEDKQTSLVASKTCGQREQT